MEEVETTVFWGTMMQLPKLSITIENNLGSSLPGSELKAYQETYANYSLTVAYAWPVNLLSTDRKFSASAKWVDIQWNRGDNSPNALFYGSKIKTVDGGFQITAGIDDLAQAVSLAYPDLRPPTSISP